MFRKLWKASGEKTADDEKNRVCQKYQAINNEKVA